MAYFCCKDVEQFLTCIEDSKGKHWAFKNRTHLVVTLVCVYALWNFILVERWVDQWGDLAGLGSTPWVGTESACGQWNCPFLLSPDTELGWHPLPSAPYFCNSQLPAWQPEINKQLEPGAHAHNALPFGTFFISNFYLRALVAALRKNQLARLGWLSAELGTYSPLNFLWRFLLPSAHLSTYFAHRFLISDNNLLGGF